MEVVQKEEREAAVVVVLDVVRDQEMGVAGLLQQAIPAAVVVPTTLQQAISSLPILLLALRDSCFSIS